MPEKPSTAAGYPSDQVARVKATCLYLATKLGDLMPELVVVGGLVPALLIDQENLPENITPHVGTMDLDLALAFALVGETRYQEVAERLRSAKFTPDKNDEGNTTRQRWRRGCCRTNPTIATRWPCRLAPGAHRRIRVTSRAATMEAWCIRP